MHLLAPLVASQTAQPLVASQTAHARKQLAVAQQSCKDDVLYFKPGLQAEHRLPTRGHGEPHHGKPKRNVS